MKLPAEAKGAQASSRACLASELTCRLEMLRALNEREVSPYFQPSICLKTRKVLGVEILARWKHPERGLVSPQSFLGLIKSQGLHKELFFCLLEQGLILHSCLHSIGESLVFSYNIEATQLAEIGFAERLILQVKNAGVPLRQVILEVTEKESLILDFKCVENLERLVKSGVRLSLDDFGTGHSSIMRLAQMPFSQIKLDAEFISCAQRYKHTRIIECVVNLAKSLDVELIAEGVESEEQCAYLVKLGVEKAQGFLFHKPMEGNELLKIIFAERHQQSY